MKKRSGDSTAVETGSARLWGMTLDNHLEDRVVAWLGDLGRDLPYTEQLYWRSYNIVPTGGVSETFFKRQILAEFTDFDRPEHVFKYLFHELKKSCDEKLGCPQCTRSSLCDCVTAPQASILPYAFMVAREGPSDLTGCWSTGDSGGLNHTSPCTPWNVCKHSKHCEQK